MYDLLLDVGECRLEQVRRVLAQEDRVADGGIRNGGRVKERDGDLVRLDKLEHPRKQQRLELETALVVRIRKHIENVLHDAKEVLLEECVRDLWLGASEVVDDLEGHYGSVSKYRLP